MEKEKTIFLLSLLDLTPDNVKEVFENNFNQWLYRNSSETIVNGKTESKGLERFFLMLPDKDGMPNIKTLEKSDTTEKGFELKKQTFINEELKKYIPLYEYSIGSVKNREKNLILELYIDYLKETQQHQDKTPKLKADDYGELQYNDSDLTLLHGHFNNEGKIWEPITINEFYNNFKTIPAKTLNIKSEIAFSYLMRNYYDSAKLFDSDIKVWYKDHFNIANVSNHKSRKTYDDRVKDSNESSYNKKTNDDILIDYINNKLKPM